MEHSQLKPGKSLGHILYELAHLLHLGMLHKGPGQHRANIMHALIEWHVIEKSTILLTAKFPVENCFFLFSHSGARPL